jgi:hypothetical protein
VKRRRFGVNSVIRVDKVASTRSAQRLCPVVDVFEKSWAARGRYYQASAFVSGALVWLRTIELGREDDDTEQTGDH